MTFRTQDKRRSFFFSFFERGPYEPHQAGHNRTKMSLLDEAESHAHPRARHRWQVKRADCQP